MFVARDAYLRAKRKYFQRLFKTWWIKLNIYCTTFDYNVWSWYHSRLECRRSFLFILYLFLNSLLSPFLSMCIQLFFLPRNKIALTVCNKTQQNACYIYIYILYAYYILLLMYITKTKSLLWLIN
jgi:hypothetical protein